MHIFNAADYPIFVKFHDTAGVPTAGAAVAAQKECRHIAARKDRNACYEEQAKAKAGPP